MLAIPKLCRHTAQTQLAISSALPRFITSASTLPTYSANSPTVVLLQATAGRRHSSRAIPTRNVLPNVIARTIKPKPQSSMLNIMPLQVMTQGVAITVQTQPATRSAPPRPIAPPAPATQPRLKPQIEVNVPAGHDAAGRDHGPDAACYQICPSPLHHQQQHPGISPGASWGLQRPGCPLWGSQGPAGLQYLQLAALAVPALPAHSIHTSCSGLHQGSPPEACLLMHMH